ncbi:MAG: DNA topoisomerase IV subunit A, partial [Lentisphaeria bacterium]|nr:DNA topoisomerase IV subunit A [Lentisphaeria bacterium]
MSDETEKIPQIPEAESCDGEEAVNQRGDDAYLRAMVDRNFLDYAAYVIKDRAIPDVDDGLKPVQRRILWALKEKDDGRTHKAANIIGDVMHYHPHGDASIGDALVVLANKEYYIVKQGNYGNPITGSPAAAPRYIECGLSKLGREVLFNDDLTEFVDSYDGRSKEPVVLPVKIPSLLMLGSDGIAVGMATTILPHNFCELLQAQISELRHEPFPVYPDFRQGGLMDVSEYADGNGRIVLRAKIELDEKHR